MIVSEPKLSHIRKGMDLVKVRAVDDTGALDVTFFNQSWLKNQLRVGETYTFYGRAEGSLLRKSMASPIVEPEGRREHTGRIVPIYPLTAGVTQNLLLRAVEKHGFISYGKALEFQHSWEAFAPEAQQLLRLLRRQLSAKEGAEAALRSYGNAPRSGPAGGIPLNGEIFDGLVALYAPTGNLGGYTLNTGIPALTMRVEKRRGGVEVSVTPALGWKTGLDNDYLYLSLIHI